MPIYKKECMIIILEQRLRKDTDHQLEQSQSGFRKVRSIQDNTFIIKNIT